ncbi:phosphatase PAP2 family protein [Bacillus halotolerans]|uniref:phosphatase PAP2 family protein n=1 Tax=Bacillus halotolerans TaxID=260554 RepID=UPI0007519457|nr:phosphatase PAP2 family protein [Bacillus halotolerans]KUP42226.1 phosphatase [Bacillus halotolerans]MBJ7571345.1 phosphatase PAP2 family protein [Bacillus halotolerans]MBT9250081.1 phosphatase PAP2 family protein [Bacillus halotolerans]MEC1544328.1 phosphatase PAP2 family protein [Bacillus halotolerans]PSB00149.1 phosphatase PAP2 family protein [Bacillus halotolerans]
MYKPVSLFLLFLFLAAVIHTSAVQSTDEMISRAAAAIRQPWLNDVMIWVTHLGATSFLLPLIVVIGAGLFFYKRTLDGLLMLFIFGADRLLNKILKEWIERSRPDFEPLVHESSFSFPSGHSMNAACVYPVIAYFLVKHIPFLSKHKKAVYIIAGTVVILVGASRVYLGVHFLTDVLGGFSLGLLLFFLVKGFDEKFHSFRQK